MELSLKNWHIVKSSKALPSLIIYRYFSLAISSMFFLLIPMNTTLVFQTTIICTLIIKTIFIKNFIQTHRDNIAYIKWLTVIESLSISILLYLTGAMESPFLLYALNPVITAASFLSISFFGGIVGLYFLGIAISMNQLPIGNLIFDFISSNGYLIIFVYLILLILQLFKQNLQLQNKHNELSNEMINYIQSNEELSIINEKSKATIQHIISLYQSLNFISSKEYFLETILEFMEKVIESSEPFFLFINKTEPFTIAESSTSMPLELQKVLVKKLAVHKDQSSISIKILGNSYRMVRVQTTSETGYIGIRHVNSLTDFDERLLMFLADLCSVILEKFHLKETSDHFLIAEEQNRIADEIHDSVSQRVFGIVYGLQSLKKKAATSTTENIVEQIQSISETAHLTMLDLRASIYQLSTKKKGQSLLISKIKDFLNEISSLHQVKVTTDIQGDDDTLTSEMKKAIYRIVCEASGNALKHGRAKELFVRLYIGQGKLTLSIKDNGIGFDTSKQNDETSGIGLRNMRNLVHSFNGNIDFYSSKLEGTNVDIQIPIKVQNQEAI